MRLVQLLVACAEAVVCRDRAQAAALLRELQVGAPVHSTAFQRVASCSCRAWRTGWPWRTRRRWVRPAWRSASRGRRASMGRSPWRTSCARPSI
uniref:Uncharacterized protein n=1 Tax=Aegilops tauschii subsp. strangulata TaxID=200361 RepID=A0A453GFG8_AEGTS